MGRKSRERKLNKPEAKKSLNFKIVIVGLILVIIVVSFGVLAGASYTGFGSPPIPKSAVRLADITIASFSVLPKTPNQVISKAFFETSRVNSGEHNFNLDLNQNVGSEKKPIFSLNIVGPFKKENNQIDLAGKATFSLQGRKDLSTINFVETDDFAYFGLEDVPSIFGLDLSKLDGWYKLDVTKILSDAEADVRADEEIEKTVSEKVQIILDNLNEGGAIKNLVVLPDENIDGKYSYHYQINLDETLTREMINALTQDSEGLPNFEKISLEIWIDKDNFVINKLLINGVIAPDSENPTSNVVLKAPDISFSLTYQLSNPNGEIKINPPESAKSIDSLLDLYLLVQGEDKADPASIILGAASNLGEFGANFLTVERLIHVLYLTPQSY